MEGSADFLPKYPKLQPGVEIVQIKHDQILLRSFRGTVMLSGDLAISALPKILNEIDGTNTVEDMSKAVLDMSQQEVKELLLILFQKDLLVDGYGSNVEGEAGDTTRRRDHEAAYWKLFESAKGNDALARLDVSTVVVVGLGGIGSNVTRSLALSGLGKIIGVDSEEVQSSDHIFGYQVEDIGKLRAEALSTEITAKYPGTAFVPITERLDEANAINPLILQADAVVVCSDNMSMAGYDLINKICIEHQMRWVSARIDRHRGIIGPFVQPGQTACFTCFELRSRVNSTHPEDHEALYQYWKTLRAVPNNWPLIAPSVSLLGNYLALDIVKVLAGRGLSALLGRVLYLDFQTLESKFHEILKLPRCPACSRGRDRPLTKIWDIG